MFLAIESHVYTRNTTRVYSRMTLLLPLDSASTLIIIYNRRSTVASTVESSFTACLPPSKPP